MPDTIAMYKLPPEIRDLIWAATLPSTRLFHVQNIVSQPQHPHARFVFYQGYAPPVALSICRESRAAALRAGFFLPSPDYAIWFNPNVDMLYIDRNHRRFIQGKSKSRPDSLARVKHLALEWRAWFLDVPTMSVDEIMLPWWRTAFEALDVICPELETINFVLPQIRHCGGVTFGREPYGAGKHGCTLVPLPMKVEIPWGTRLSAAAPTNMTLAQLGAVQLGSMLTARLSNWEAVRRQMLKGLEGAEEGKKLPEVLGWWLLRDDAHVLLEHRDVKQFL